MLTDGVELIDGGERVFGVAKEKTINQIGEIVPINGVVRWTTPNRIRMLSLKARVTVAPTGSALVCVIKNNGVAVSAPITIPANATSVTVSAAQLSKTIFEPGSYFTLDVTSVGSVVKGSNLSVQLNYVEVPL